MPPAVASSYNSRMTTLLAAIAGGTLWQALVWIIVAALLFFILNYFLIDYIKIAEPFQKVAKVVIALIVVVLLVNGLLMLVGHPLIVW